MLKDNFELEEVVHTHKAPPNREAVAAAVIKLAQKDKLKLGLRQVFAAVTQEEREGACYEIAWPMLHSRDYYDDLKCRFKLGDWNKAVSQQNSKNEPLPIRERFDPQGMGFLRLSHTDDLTMTSLTKNQIKITKLSFQIRALFSGKSIRFGIVILCSPPSRRVMKFRRHSRISTKSWYLLNFRQGGAAHI